MGVWNVRGIGDGAKREEVVNVFKRGKFELLALNETKLKGKEEFCWDGVRGVRSGVNDNVRGKEGVAVLMNDEWFAAMVGYECVNSRLLWVKLRFKKVKLCIVVAYGPCNDRSVREKDKFWRDLEKVMNAVGNGYRLLVVGDLNGKVGECVRDGITGAFGVPEMNENGERVVDFCAERELSVANTYFQHKNIHKYTWSVRRGENECKSLIDLVLVKKEMMRDILDVKAIRGLNGGISDHMIVLCKLRLIGSWVKKRQVECKVGRIRSERLTEAVKSQEYVRILEGRKEEMDGHVDVGQMWMKFKEVIIDSAREVCGVARVGKRKLNAEWWSEDVRSAIEKKSQAYASTLQNVSREERERRIHEYKKAKNEVKRIIKRSKREANENFGKKLSQDVNGNRKLFWKEVKKVKNEGKESCMGVKGKNGRVLVSETEIKERWKEYFVELYNVGTQEGANVNMFGFAGVKRVMYRGQEPISWCEVEKAVKKLKNGKSAGVDEITGEMLKMGGVCVMEWLWKLCCKVFEKGVVPEDWKKAVIVPLYKGKGAKGDCKNYRGISLLSIVGKVYGMILVDRMRRITDGMIGDEQGGFRAGRGCVDQVFAVRQLTEKARERGQKVYAGFMDLEKAYDRVDREALWKVLRMYDVSGKLLNGVKSFYEGSSACVRVRGSLSEWFGIDSGVRQGCVMSPWLFNIYMDGVMKEVRPRVGSSGVRLIKGVNEWTLSDLLYADDLVLVGENESELKLMIESFDKVCIRRGMRVNADKSKVMVFGGEDGSVCDIRIGGVRLEQVQSFKYLGSVLNVKGNDEADCENKVVQGRKVSGAIRALVNAKGMSVECARVLHESMLVPTLVYGSEVMVWKEKERSRIRAVQMDNLRGMLGIKRVDKIRNEKIKEVYGIKKGVNEVITENILRWYGHVRRMDDDRIVKRIYESECKGKRRRGRPCKRWIDSVNECLSERGLNEMQAERIVYDRRRWRGYVRGDAWGPAPGDEP